MNTYDVTITAVTTVRVKAESRDAAIADAVNSTSLGELSIDGIDASRVRTHEMEDAYAFGE